MQTIFDNWSSTSPSQFFSGFHGVDANGLVVIRRQLKASLRPGVL